MALGCRGFTQSSLGIVAFIGGEYACNGAVGDWSVGDGKNLRASCSCICWHAVCEVSLYAPCMRALLAKYLQLEYCTSWPFGLWRFTGRTVIRGLRGVIVGEVACPCPAGLEGYHHHPSSFKTLLSSFLYFKPSSSFSLSKSLSELLAESNFADFVVLHVFASKVSATHLGVKVFAA